jgi:hypothetical protein
MTSGAHSSIVLFFSVACGSALAQSSQPADPAAVFQVLEKGLLAASAVILDFHVIAEGVVEADLRGKLEIRSEQQTRLTASGRFGGQPVSLQLDADGEHYELDNGAGLAMAMRPAYLEEAIIIGLTRMGILHNLARLVGGVPPDHSEGGAGEWVTVDSFTTGGADAASISFDITVAEQPAGSASLEVDSQGNPVVRRQTVQFESGEMRVVERYSTVTIEP